VRDQSSAKDLKQELPFLPLSISEPRTAHVKHLGEVLSSLQGFNKDSTSSLKFQVPFFSILANIILHSLTFFFVPWF